MGILNCAELERRIQRGELIRHARMLGTRPEVQPASYDLTAGTVVWAERVGKQKTIRQLRFDSSAPVEQQPYAVLHPGQIMSVITHEEILMPIDLCGTVFSKNRLALNGIFAFNAGHVDPGFEGPIVIRLINLRAAPWPLTLGQRIFTIVFQTLDVNEEDRDRLRKRPRLTPEETLIQVRQFASDALSNALFDLYIENIDERLGEHRAEILATLRDDLSKEFLKTDNFSHAMKSWLWKSSFAILALVGTIVALVKNWGNIVGWITSK